MIDNIRIFIHGRPQGQDIWSNSRYLLNDKTYIEPFLDSKIGSDVEAVVVIDTWDNSTYYTYVRRKNVIENNRGPGYFAITVCLPQLVCRNVNKLYDLLDQIYNKKCSNRILTNEKGVEQFIINGFNEVESLLEEISNLIIANSRCLHIENLDSQKDTIYSNVKQYSLADIDSPSFIKDADDYKLVVSRDYPTKTSTLQADLKNLRQEKERLEGQLKQANASAELKCKKQLDEQEATISKLQAENDKLNSKLNEALSKNKKLEGESQNYAKHQKVLDFFGELKEPLFNIARLTASRFPDSFKNNFEFTETKDKKSNQKSYSQVWILWINSAMLFILIAFAVNFLPIGKNNGQDMSSLNEELTSIRKKYELLRDSVENHLFEYSKIDNNLPLYKINIGGWDGKGSLKPNTQYTLNLKDYKGDKDSIVYHIEKGSVTINKDLLMVLEAGEIIIGGFGPGLKVESRTVTAG